MGRKFLRCVEVEGETYSEDQLKNCSYEDLKMIMSFCEDIKDVKRVANLSDNYLAQNYADNLECQINGLNNPRRGW